MTKKEFPLQLNPTPIGKNITILSLVKIPNKDHEAALVRYFKGHRWDKLKRSKKEKEDITVLLFELGVVQPHLSLKVHQTIPKFIQAVRTSLESKYEAGSYTVAPLDLYDMRFLIQTTSVLHNTEVLILEPLGIAPNGEAHFPVFYSTHENLAQLLPVKECLSAKSPFVVPVRLALN